ncbi:IPT/TIG domain-containing protein [Streptomyces sp. NPDC020845]|uniref:IPT/TIG domain-containing protein n=1 Tax=Streptomyces sp. NPDC020845 TaxID=3365096 RepID=UPI0037A5E8F5
MPTITPPLVDTTTGTNQGKGGDTLTISGSGFTGATKVNFGAKSITSGFTVNGAGTTVTVTSIPVLCSGQVPVSVTVGSITSNSAPFFYIAQPVCNTVTNNQGPAGATSVTLSGSGFLTATGVTFTGVGPATGTFPPTSDTQLTVTTPAHTTPIAGCTDTVSVVVTSAGGTSTPSGSGSQYTFYDAPGTPTVGPASGPVGSGVTIDGTCLVGATEVAFITGTTVVPADFDQVSNTQITATVPNSLVVGTTYDVRVTTPGGQGNAVLGFAVTA